MRWPRCWRIARSLNSRAHNEQARAQSIQGPKRQGKRRPLNVSPARAARTPVRHLHVSDDKIHNGGRGKDCCGFISRGRFHHVVTFKAQPLGEGMPQNRIIFSNENIRHALRFRIVNENSADHASGAPAAITLPAGVRRSPRLRVFRYQLVCDPSDRRRCGNSMNVLISLFSFSWPTGDCCGGRRRLPPEAEGPVVAGLPYRSLRLSRRSIAISRVCSRDSSSPAIGNRIYS
jgi:hypothetical protein